MVRPESQFSTLPRYFTTAEKLLEVGKYFITDKLVYVDELLSRDDDVFRFVSKVNVDLDRWIEFHVRLCGKWEAYYTGIIRPARNGRHVGWKTYRNLCERTMDRDSPMFVDIPEPMQLPQFRRLISVPMVVWLKQRDDLPSLSGNAAHGIFERPCPLGVIDGDNGKASTKVDSATASVCESTSKVIQRGTHAADCISSNQTEDNVDWGRIEVENVLSCFKVILCPNSMSLALQKAPDFNVQTVQVFLRPTQLERGIEFWEA